MQVSLLEITVPFQPKYGYITDEMWGSKVTKREGGLPWAHTAAGTSVVTQFHSDVR